MVMFVVWMMGLADVAVAQAPPDPTTTEARMAQARELYKLGAGLYKAGRYKEAIVSFEEAYELSDNKKILYNIANAKERLGDLQGAIDSLMEYRPYASPSDVVSLDLRIAAMEDRMAEAPPPAPAAPPAPALAPAPGAAGQPPSGVASQPLLEPPPKRQPRWALVGTGAVLAAGFGATAVVTYLRGQDEQAAFDQDAYAVSRTINNFAVPLAGVGGGLVILGFALPKERRVSVSPTPTGANFRLTF